MLEPDAAAASSCRPGRRGRRDLHRRVEQSEDALGRSHRRLQDVELLRQVADRLEEALRVLQARDQHAELDRVLHGPPAAVPDDEGSGARAQYLDRRVEGGVVEDGLDVGVAVRAVDPLELLEVARLPAEELHGCHAADVLLQERVDAGDLNPYTAVRLARVHPEPVRHPGDGRQDGEGDQRQAPVHPEQDDHDAGEHEDVTEDRYDPGREQLVEGVDVGGDAGHQPADRIAVVESEIEALEMAVDLHPQIEHDPLPHHLHRPCLHVLEHERAGENEQKRQGDTIEAIELARCNVVVDGNHRQPGLGELERGPGQNRGQGNSHGLPVRTQVAEQAPHEPRVVRLAQNLGFVKRHGYDSSSASSSNCFRCSPA